MDGAPPLVPALGESLVRGRRDSDGRGWPAAACFCPVADQTVALLSCCRPRIPSFGSQLAARRGLRASDSNLTEQRKLEASADPPFFDLSSGQ
uniref:Uncharacterized protein n=1 Tax=Zea mays TaxID=4577 RepID=A0A804LUI4_MAIZE